MDRIEKQILVSAPTASVFRFVNEPFNLLRICPGMIEVTDVVQLKNGGRDFQCESKMADTHIYYSNECVEHLVNQSIGYKFSGGLHGSIHRLIEGQNEQTLVSVVLEYEVPPPLLKHHTEAEIVQRNEQAMQQLLRNLKTTLERQFLVQSEADNA